MLLKYLEKQKQFQILLLWSKQKREGMKCNNLYGYPELSSLIDAEPRDDQTLMALFDFPRRLPSAWTRRRLALCSTWFLGVFDGRKVFDGSTFVLHLKVTCVLNLLCFHVEQLGTVPHTRDVATPRPRLWRRRIDYTSN